MGGTSRQRDAVESHDRSCVVTAGAGTGKTYVLVERYLAILRQNPAISVANILALTFTEKAAAEMKERVRAGLAKEEGPRWERAQREFFIAPVRTFHSFCAQVLREYAFEAGLEPSFAVMDEQEAGRIITRSLERLVRIPPADEREADALVRVLVVAGEYTLGAMLRALLARREDAEAFFERFIADPASVFQEWRLVLEEMQARETNGMRDDPTMQATARLLISLAGRCRDPSDKAAMYLGEVTPLLAGILSPGSNGAFLAAADAFCQKKLGNAGLKKNWAEPDLKALRDARSTLAGCLSGAARLRTLTLDPEAPLTHATRTFLVDLAIVFSRFCCICDQEKEATAALDFDDLVRLTLRLFRKGSPDIASRYRARFPYILVDESQDTDPAQYEIIAAINGEPDPSRAGLFLVGDPKQSIYLFRGADVTRFRAAQEMVTGPCQGVAVSLDVSFRSTPAVIGLVNHLFSRLFHPETCPYDFPYERTAVSEERKSHGGSTTLILTGEEHGISEPLAVAGHIQALVSGKTVVYEKNGRDPGGNVIFLERPAQYGDIALLLEQRTHLGDYLHALRAAGIPFHVHSGTGFYQRQEISDLSGIIRFLVAPHDDLALLAILRSPWFGLSDSDIFYISQCQGETLFGKLQKRGESDPAVRRVYSLLAGWRKRYGRERIVPLIRSMLLESGVIAVYGGMEDGEQICANIERLIGRIRAAEEKGWFRPDTFSDDLVHAIEEEEREGEAPIIGPERNVIHVMTVHAAKGLEFPIVILPEMGKRPSPHSLPLLMDRGGRMIGLHLPDPGHDWERVATPVYRFLQQEADIQEIAERRRLFYVALTRARDHLVMTATVNTPEDLTSDSTRLGWTCTNLGITGDAIAAGGIVVPASSGEEPISLSIISHGGTKPRLLQRVPPFTLPDSERDTHGRFTLPESYAGCARVLEPVPVTTLSRLLQEQDGKTGKRTSQCVAGSDPGYAARFGDAIHLVLRGRDAERIAGESGISDPEDAALLHRVYDEFSSHPDVQGAEPMEREKAFILTIGDVTLTGRIDLVLRRPDGSYLVVDYKSESLNAGGIAATPTHRVQVEIYRRAAEALGMHPVHAALYCVRTRDLVILPQMPDQELACTLEEANRSLSKGEQGYFTDT